MRAVSALLAMAFAMGCEPIEMDPVEMVDPVEVGMEGVYTPTRCNFGPPTPPCATYVSGISTHILDSARLTLNRDGTATWMAATQGHLCEIGKPCTYSQDFEERQATYRILSNKVQVFRLNTGMADSIIEFGVTIPGTVRRTWSGPDTLNLGGNRSVTFGRAQ